MVKHGRSKAGGYSWPYWVLGFFGLFALGTFIVLQTVKHFFGTNELDFISLEEVRALKFEHVLPFNASMSPADALAEEQRTGLRREKIPRIIHQTWKTETLPERWVAVRKDCMRMLPNYEFKMWTDVTSREFIQTEYPSFLATWDSYTYNIQRADAIRYFVLHKYGGIYMDLDIGCRAHPGPLMHFESILPVTKPVGVSNDLLFSAPATPFMDLVINSLETFNHEWLWMNYPTVMFSTGPMFISAIYSMWNRILDKGVGVADEHLHKRVRILPKLLYGKNALPEDVPESFFWHYYGSSWHASDAGFIGFLGKYGYGLLITGTTLVGIGFCYLLWTKRQYLPFSPKSYSKGLERFDSIPALSSSPNPPLRSPVESFFKTAWSAVVGLVSPPSTMDIAYSPLPTTGDSHTSPRPPSMDADAVSLHSVYYNDASAPPRIRQHPITKKPSVRQKSRDVERGSPNVGRSASDKAQWSWLPQQGAAAPSRLDTPIVAAQNGAPNGTLQRPALPMDRRKLSDSESEVMDKLTDLEPVTSATTARGATTPREVIADPFSAMRKRSASSEGDRFYKENGITPGSSRNPAQFKQ